MTEDKVSWWLSPKTAERLKLQGKFGDTQNDVVARLLDELDEKERTIIELERTIEEQQDKEREKDRQ